MIQLEDKGKQARTIESTALSTLSKNNIKRKHSQGLSRGRYNKDSKSTLYPKKVKRSVYTVTP